MTKCAPMGRLFLLLFAAFSFAGCSQFKRGTVSEEKDPYFLEGKKRANAMDWDGAIKSFERALQSNPANSAAHFELGVLYDTRKNDFATAIHYYQKHLNLRTNSPMAELVNQNIIACKRELAKSVANTLVPRDVQRDLERFAQTNALLQQRIDLLQAELNRRPQYITNYVTNFVQMPQFDPRHSARLTQPAPVVQPQSEPQLPIADLEPVRPTPTPSRSTEPKRSAARAESTRSGARKTHTVRPGDTMDAVARRYGVSVAALKAANPSARNGTRSGQQLIIPEK